LLNKELTAPIKRNQYPDLKKKSVYINWTPRNPVVIDLICHLLVVKQRIDCSY